MPQAVVEIIALALTAAGTAYGITTNAGEKADAAKAAAAAQKNAALDAEQQKANAANTALDTQVQTAQSTNTSLADQIKAKIAAGQAQTPGMSPDFYTGDVTSQYPGFGGLVSDIVGGGGSNPNQTTPTGVA